MKRRDLLAEMRVDLPEGEHGDVALSHFDTSDPAYALTNLRYAMSGRGCRPGVYTQLSRKGVLWMSDTDAERRDHYEAARVIAQGARSVLIGGLGLGCILRVALLTPTVETVDVVEIDPDVIALVGPPYEKMAEERGVRLRIYEGDLLTQTWTRGKAWDVAWFDIWPTLCTDDLAEHATLARKYARRAGWYGCWGHDLLLHERRRDARSPWG